MSTETWNCERRAALDILEAGTMTVAELLTFSPFPKSSLYSLVQSAPFDVRKRRHDECQKIWNATMAKYGVQAEPAPMKIRQSRKNPGREFTLNEAIEYFRAQGRELPEYYRKQIK